MTNIGEKPVNIAIDGPAGAGKSTIAKRVAKALSFVYVDTGAMYRAMAIFFLRKGIPASDAEAISATCREAEITIDYEDGMQHVYLNGEDVTPLLRTQEVGEMASASSTNGDVRNKLVELQQALGSKKSVVMDGRDIGTVVLPDAQVKIYLTADVEVRAKRRFLELKEKGEDADLTQIEKEIRERDDRDMNRAIAPLKPAEDAVTVDSSYLTIEEVAERILAIVTEKTGIVAQEEKA